MDVLVAKKCLSLNNLTSIFKNTSLSTKPFTSSVAGDLRYGERDALRAVKLDPAVLEAQVTMPKNLQQKQPDTTRSHSVVSGPPSSLSSTASSSTASSSTASSSTAAAESFNRMLAMQLEALQSISPEQLALLMKYVGTMRRQRAALQRTLECALCKNNGESVHYYTSHALKDWRGRVLCPVLRAFRCPRCGSTGDRAHTIKYCPENDAGLRRRFRRR